MENPKEYPEIHGFKTPNKHLFDSPGHWASIDWNSVAESFYVRHGRTSMKLVEFYRGERGNSNGHMLADIYKWSNGAMDMDHDYIQWMFPTNEPSMFNFEAPLLTKDEAEVFNTDPILRTKMLDSFFRFLNYLELKISYSDEAMFVEKLHDNLPWWLNSFNHNMLRVTRVIKSLRLTGLQEYANLFFDGLKQFRVHVSDNTWGFWEEAMVGPLW